MFHRQWEWERDLPPGSREQAVHSRVPPTAATGHLPPNRFCGLVHSVSQEGEYKMEHKRNSRVILVIVEDLTSTALTKVRTPNIDILLKAGSWSLDAEPAAGPRGLHPLIGILTSRKSPTNATAPKEEVLLGGVPYSIINLAEVHGWTTAGYFNGATLGTILGDVPFDLRHCQNQDGTKKDPQSIAASAAADILAFKPDFCLVHLGSTEHVGYRPAPSSPDCLKHVEMSDRGLGILMNAMSLFGLFSDYHILLTSDLRAREMPSDEHEAESIAVPWIAFGPRIRPTFDIGRRIAVLDTTPTVAALLDLPTIPEWEGRAVEDVLYTEGKLDPQVLYESAGGGVRPCFLDL